MFSFFERVFRNWYPRSLILRCLHCNKNWVQGGLTTAWLIHFFFVFWIYCLFTYVSWLHVIDIRFPFDFNFEENSSDYIRMCETKKRARCRWYFELWIHGVHRFSFEKHRDFQRGVKCIWCSINIYILYNNERTYSLLNRTFIFSGGPICAVS